MSISTARRTQRIDLRATPRQETLIQQAASQTDRSVSEFIEAYSWGVGEYESEDGCDGFWEGL